MKFQSGRVYDIEITASALIRVSYDQCLWVFQADSRQLMELLEPVYNKELQRQRSRDSQTTEESNGK
jgi:hypothetical protein